MRGNSGNVFLTTTGAKIHHGTCVTRVPWCMPGSLTCGFLWSRWRENVPIIPSTCATCSFTYLHGKRHRGYIVYWVSSLVYSEEHTCSADQFSCGAGEACIPMTWKCDGEQDCNNQVDEQGCDQACTRPLDEFQCSNHKCISSTWRCDQDNDCGDNSDEDDCLDKTCGSHEFRCTEFPRCIPATWLCDGDYDCPDKSDEMMSTANCSDSSAAIHACSSREFMCDNHACIHETWYCDGDMDCLDNSDESNCEPVTCAGYQFTCHDGDCIMNNRRCNGISDCWDNSDELECGK